MIRVVGMFGSDAAAAKLHASLRNNRIHLERHNFQHPEDMLRRIAEEPDITAVLLVERALKEFNPEFTTVLEAIRTDEPTIRIIFVADTPERDAEFEQWCYERKIYDIVYPGRKTDVNIEAICAAILKGRISDEDEPPSPPCSTDTLIADCEKRPGLFDKLKGVTLPEFKLPTLPERTPRPKREKPDMPESQQSELDVIGVANCSRGFGATTLAVNLAKTLCKTGRSVAVLAMDGSTDLRYSDLEDFGVTIDIPGPDALPDWVGLCNGHDFVIMDFGVILDVLPSGTVRLPTASFETTRAVQEALDFCKIQLYLTSNEPWHREKLKVFGENPDLKAHLIPHEQADAETILQVLGVLS